MVLPVWASLVVAGWSGYMPEVSAGITGLFSKSLSKRLTWAFSHGDMLQVGKSSSVLDLLGLDLELSTASLPFIPLVKASQNQLRFRGQGNTFSLLKGRASKIWPSQFTTLSFSSVFFLDCALLSFLTVPALNFLLSFDKADLYHTVLFILNSFFFKQRKIGHCHS